MKIIRSLLFVFLSIGTAYSASNWEDLEYCHNIGDYKGMRTILDTMELNSVSDSAAWLCWMGEYYYWMSYDDNMYVDSAVNAFKSAIQYKEKNNGNNIPTGYCYLHLGEISYFKKDYKEGIRYLNKALVNYPFNEYSADNYARFSCVSSEPDPTNPAPVYKGLGMCHAMMGKYRKALVYLEMCDSNTADAYSAMRMKGKVFAMKGDTTSSFKCYNEFISQIRMVVRNRFQDLSQRESETWWMSVRPFIADCWRLERRAPTLLYDVALLTKGILLRQDSMSLTINHKDIQRVLTPRDVAIEWMVYENRGERQIGAVVLHSDGTIKFVHTATDNKMIDWYKELDGIFGIDSCRNAIWSDAMMKAIGNAEKIYFAPDGILSQIGIEYMFPDSGVQLHRLSSTRELLKPHSHDYSSAAIFGNIDYYLAKSDTSTVQIDNDEEAYEYAKQEGMHFDSLKHSAKECQTVFAIRHSESDTLVQGARATERNFRSIAGNYDMLFISTHGYCKVKTKFESSDFPRQDKIDHSLSESGLVFCGYNAEQNERICLTDGILSARELCGMDMKGVKLCVVSACEGAKGLTSADGTYGIQRGLKIAGVDAMILSLWKVNDQAAQLFMTYLYETMAEGKDLHEAFWKAREKLSENETTLPNVPPFRKYAEPRYLNAFILIDAI